MSELGPTITELEPTATERLRALLTERGVEWDKGSFPNEFRTYWRDVVARPWDEQRLYVTALLTTEQAIAATLDSSNCSNDCTNSERTETCEYCANGKFDGQTVMMSNHGWQRINFCPNCGRRIEVADV